MKLLNGIDSRYYDLKAAKLRNNFLREFVIKCVILRDRLQISLLILKLMNHDISDVG